MSGPTRKAPDLEEVPTPATRPRAAASSPHTLASRGAEGRDEARDEITGDWAAGPHRDSSDLPQSIGSSSPSAIGSPVGTVLGGKYRIERVIGTGGMGIVAAAHHLQLDQRVAIKYLIPEALEYPDLVQRFMREARAAARLRGEHVVRVIDVGCFDDNVPFIVLEYLEGESLAARLAAHGPLPLVEAARFVLEVCEGLAEAHAANLVHRDIKPANLFLSTQPDRRRIVKILDFGISKIIDEPLTPTLSLLGTTLYMSPEQLRSAKQVDHRTDIWSLGVVFYELLTGVPPFTGMNLIDVGANVASNLPTPLTTLRPEVSDELAAVIAKCMQTDPDARYATLLDLATDLAPLANPSDRGSVGTISRVLYGSLAPPPMPAPPPSSSRVVLSVPSSTEYSCAASLAPESLPSEAPVSRDWGELASDSSPSLPDLAAESAPEESVPEESVASASLARKDQYHRILSVVLAATFVLLAGTAWRRSQPAQQASARSASATAIPAVATPKPMTVHVTASPRHARVRIDDGELVSAPFVTSVLPDGREHRIYVEAEGHAAQTELVRFSRDITVTVVLAAE